MLFLEVAMRKRNLKDILTSPLLMTVYAIILLFVFLLFRFKTDEGIVVNSLEEKNNSCLLYTSS